MKKAMSFLFALLMVSSLTACGQKPAPNASISGSVTGASGSSGAADSYDITMASASATGCVGNLCGEKFVQLVEDATDGRIKISFYQDATLGTEIDNIQQIKTGEIQIGVFGDNFGSQMATGIDPTLIPFIFGSVDDVKAVYSDATLGKAIADTVKKNANAYLIGVSNRSPRLLTASKEIKTPGELKGVKLRLPEIKAHVTVWNSMGAISTVVALPETYSALQTGVVDAQENPIDNIFTNKFYEVNKYIMKTEHLQSLYHWCINADFFDSMSEDDQKILTDCLSEAAEWSNAELEKQDKEYWEKVTADGTVTVVDVDKNVWRDAAADGINQALADMDETARKYVSDYMGK